MYVFIGPGGAGLCSPLIYPPLPPRPFTPAGVKGSLNSQFGCFAPDTGVGAGGCSAGLLAQIGKRCGRSQRIDDGRGCASSARGASSARHPAGARPLARLSFAYFSLAKQRKVSRPTGRNRYLKTGLTFAHLSFSETKKSKAHRRHLAANRQKPSFTAHKW